MQKQTEVQSVDQESQGFLTIMAESERIRAQRVPGVRTTLIVLSSAGMVYDIESLRQKVVWAYPEAVVFFLTTFGKPIGSTPPAQVDLLLDFTGPGQRQGIFFAKKLRRTARVAVGRNAGFFRKSIYDRIFDEKAQGKKLPSEKLARERTVQREVMALAGVALVQSGDTHPDRGKSIALELPPLSRH